MPGDFGEVDFYGLNKKRFGSVAQANISEDLNVRKSVFRHEAWIDGGEPESGKLENHNPHIIGFIRRGHRYRTSKNTDTELPNATQDDEDQEVIETVP